MDEDRKVKEQAKPKDEEAQRRLEMYRKLRKDMEQDNREEKEAAYKKRVQEMESKDKSKVNVGDGDDFLKGLKSFDADE